MNGSPAFRRRRFLVKQRLQLRWMLLLVGGTVLGGVVYALVLQELLHRRIEPQLSFPYSTLGAGEPLLTLYPTVAICTVALACGMIVFALLFLKFFTRRISGSSAVLEKHLDSLTAGGDGASSLRDMPIPEFRALAEISSRLAGGYRRKWRAIDGKAGTALVALDGIEAAADREQRLIAFHKLERETSSLAESCRPRREGRG
jgi:hypothetical protein